MISRNARFAIVTLLLAGTALFLHALDPHPSVLRRTSLASFPLSLTNWAGTDIPIPDETLKHLGAGEFLQRTYRDPVSGGAYVDLYVAYVPDQRAMFHHLPQVCLEGSGWSPVETGTTMLALPGDAPFSANRYLIAKGDDRQLVLFWYSARGRRVASEDWMNVYLAFDSVRLNRSDNALIRMNTELQPGEKPEDAERRLLSFAGLVNPQLKNYIPL
ncbi:MAG: exosortase C-terminal domain/associated protein EpsI [Terriglobales bacterium]